MDSIVLIEVYKCLNKLNPSFLNGLFKPKSVSHDLRNRKLLIIPNTNTQQYGLKSLSYRGSMIWNSNNNSNLDQSKDLNQFKNRLKNQESIKCSCHLCFWGYFIKNLFHLIIFNCSHLLIFIIVGYFYVTSILFYFYYFLA